MSWLSDSVREFFRKGDLLLLSLCLFASGYGLVLIYSATRYLRSNRSMLVQCAAIALGVVVYIFMSSVDIELFTGKSWKLLILFNIGFNLLVRTPLGIEDDSGNLSWIHIPGFPVNLQPGEIVKLSFVLLLAWQMNRLQKKGISRPSAVFQIAGHALFLFALLTWASGDFGMGLTPI